MTFLAYGSMVFIHPSQKELDVDCGVEPIILPLCAVKGGSRHKGMRNITVLAHNASI